jgi:hypothetical protein
MNTKLTIEQQEQKRLFRAKALLLAASAPTYLFLLLSTFGVIDIQKIGFVEFMVGTCIIHGAIYLAGKKCIAQKFGVK